MADTVRPFLGPRVMEIGAGIGNLTVQLCPKRQWYVASDVDEEHLARMRLRLKHRRHVEAHRCDLQCPEDFARFQNAFDTVVCLNVLEHVFDDRAGLQNINSALVKGGRAIILVPEGMPIYGSLDRMLGHFRRYSESELRSKMEQAGFHVERVLKFNRISRPGWYVNGRLLKRTGLSRFQIRTFDRLLVPLWRKLDDLLPWAPVSLITESVRAESSGSPLSGAAVRRRQQTWN